MGTVKLLDCTLRDGGYINDWKFGKAAISGILKKLEATGAEILELGFLRDEPYAEDRTVFNSMDQVKNLIEKKKAGIQYAVMAEVANPFPLEMLEPADSESADIIRVIVWKTKLTADGEKIDALREGFEYCKGVVEKGYRLCVQPARVDQYSDEEFSALIRQFSQLNPMAIYVVDSWGTQNAEELLHYMRIADQLMPASVALGYHGHNNMMQALSVAQAMLKEGFARDIMIDASIYGIGRGAGNLNLELIGQYLNDQYEKCYEIVPMLAVYESDIQPIYQMEPWGYSVPFLLTAFYNCNPNYARYLGNTLQLDVDCICYILSKLSAKERTIYRKETADFYLAAYRSESVAAQELKTGVQNHE